MNDQERQVISDIFHRLEQVADQPRDPETERFIAEKVRQQPYAPYAMAQAIYVQEQALANLNAEVEQLRAELDELHRSRQGGGGLFSGIFGGGSRAPEPPRPAAGSPWGRQGPQPMPGGHNWPQHGPMPGQGFGRPSPWGGMQARGGGGFLQNAMATAAGVAGGMMIANALSNAFGGNEAAGAGSGAAADAAGLDNQAGEGSATDPLHQEAAADEADFGDDFGAGDGGDWA